MDVECDGIALVYGSEKVFLTCKVYGYLGRERLFEHVCPSEHMRNSCITQKPGREARFQEVFLLFLLLLSLSLSFPFLFIYSVSYSVEELISIIRPRVYCVALR